MGDGSPTQSHLQFVGETVIVTTNLSYWVSFLACYQNTDKSETEKQQQQQTQTSAREEKKIV
jgi:hypothetical protein